MWIADCGLRIVGGEHRAGRALSSTIPVAAALLLCVSAYSQGRLIPAEIPDVEILKKERTVTLHDDGRVTDRLSVEMRVNSLFGMSALCDPRILYNKEKQDLVVYRATVTTPAGIVLDSPPRAMNSSTPDAVAFCSEFGQYAELVVTFVGIEPGAVTHLDYELRDIEAWRDSLDVLFHFGERFPVKESRLRVRAPGSSPVDAKVLANGLATITTAEPAPQGSEVLREWAAANLPAYDYLDEARTMLVPAVVLSTGRSWQEALGRVARSARPKTPGLTAAEQGLLAVAATDTEAKPAGRKLLAITRRLRELVRQVPPEVVDLSVAPRAAEEVARTRQASPLESATLLVRLLSEAGFPTRLLLASVPLPMGSGEADKLPPALSLFNSALVEVTVDGAPLYVEARGFEPLPGVRLGERRLLAELAPGGTTRFVRPAEPSQAASVQVSVSVELTGGQVRVTAVFEAVGGTGLYGRWMSAADDTDSGKAVLSEILPGLTVDEVKLSRSAPDALSGTVVGHKAVSWADGPLLVGLGPLAGSAGWPLEPWLARRLDGPASPGGVSYELALTVKAGEETVIAGIPAAHLADERVVYEATSGEQVGVLTATRHLRVAPGAAAAAATGASLTVPEGLLHFFADNDLKVMVVGPK